MSSGSCWIGAVSDADEQLLTRQAMLQAQVPALLGGGLRDLLAEVGPVLLTGSFVSGLMSWPEVDVMVLGGPDFTPGDVLALMGRIVALPGVVGLEYSDERGTRCPTDHRRDERFHVGITVEHGGETWHVDVSVWLHDIHVNVTEWHEQLRGSVTPGQRAAILWIKDVWHRSPTYQGGLEVYTAVLENGVRTPEEFGVWRTATG
jgi:hypothetical protein